MLVGLSRRPQFAASTPDDADVDGLNRQSEKGHVDKDATDHHCDDCGRHQASITHLISL
jgi:hypothetical protein